MPIRQTNGSMRFLRTTTTSRLQRSEVQAGFGGPAEEAAAWLAYADEGASHIMIRFAGDHDNNLEKFAKIRSTLGW